MHSKFKFATQENTYQRFQEDNTPDILLGIMRLLGRRRITLNWATQIVIFNLNYNACSSNQAEKKISWIRQSNQSTAHILIRTDVRIEQQIMIRHNKHWEPWNMTIRQAWVYFFLYTIVFTSDYVEVWDIHKRIMQNWDRKRDLVYHSVK